jgi:hypothetical protein
MRRFISSLVIAAFCATGGSAFAQFGAVTDGVKKAGSVTKEAGKTTVDATKKGAKATAKGTKKVATEANDVVQTTYACGDGTTDKATVKDNACRSHGGVKADAKTKH